MTYQLDPSDTKANELFHIVKISDGVAEIRCRGGLDVETYSAIIFKVGMGSRDDLHCCRGVRAGRMHVTVQHPDVSGTGFPAF
jgi:hypothetical protein